MHFKLPLGNRVFLQIKATLEEYLQITKELKVESDEKPEEVLQAPSALPLNPQNPSEEQFKPHTRNDYQSSHSEKATFSRKRKAETENLQILPVPQNSKTVAKPKRSMHPENKYFESEPNFCELADNYPYLRPYVNVMTKKGQKRAKFDWTNPQATRELTRALLHQDFKVNW